MTKPPPLPPLSRSAPPPPSAPAKTFTFAAPTASSADRIIFHGTGGIGKTSAALGAPKPIAVFDFDQSLGQLLKSGINMTDVNAVGGVASWSDLRAALAPGKQWDGIKSIVIDTLTAAEEMCVRHVLSTVMMKDGSRVEKLADFGYGKGEGYVYDEFCRLLGDLDAHIRAGRNVVLVCHECTSKVPNPEGEDYIRYEPRLQNTNNGNVRMKVKEWGDHLFFVHYDVATKDKRAKGSGSRQIYTTELPWCMAKSRTLAETIPYDKGSTALWEMLAK